MQGKLPGVFMPEQPRCRSTGNTVFTGLISCMISIMMMCNVSVRTRTLHCSYIWRHEMERLIIYYVHIQENQMKETPQIFSGHGWKLFFHFPSSVGEEEPEAAWPGAATGEPRLTSRSLGCFMINETVSLICMWTINSCLFCESTENTSYQGWAI